MANATAAWRVLEDESRRAAKDAALAPHFAATLLIPQPPSSQPLLSLQLLQLNPSYLFALGCTIMGAIHTPIIPASTAAPYNLYDRATQFIQGTIGDVLGMLRNPTVPFFAPAAQGQAHPEDLTQHEGKNLILGLYPRTQEEGGPKIIDIPAPIPSTTAYDNGRAFSPLDSEQRGQLVQSIMHRFSNTNVALQALHHISPGATPADPRAIPFGDILLEMGEALTSDETIVTGIMNRWWGSLLFQRPVGASVDEIAGKTEWIVERHIAQCLTALVRGMERGRPVDVHGVVRGIQVINQLDWSFIVKSFDNDQQVFAKQSSAPFIHALFTLIPPSSHPPIKGLISIDQGSIRPWQYSLPFLRILENITPLSGDAYHLSALQASITRLISEHDIKECSAAIQSLLANKLNNIWNVREIYDVLARILKEMPQELGGNQMRTQEQQVEMQQVVDDILGKAMTATPELLLVGLNQVQVSPSDAVPERPLTLRRNRGPTCTRPSSSDSCPCS